MCGIFGLAILSHGAMLPSRGMRLIRRLAVLSERRGNDAAGFAWMQAGQWGVLKQAVPVSRLISRPSVRRRLADLCGGQGQWFLVGHSRLATNGDPGFSPNNQPVRHGDWIAVHNGIVADEAVWKIANRVGSLDTELLVRYLQAADSNGLRGLEAIQSLFARLEGSASLALLQRTEGALYLASNTGSLYFCQAAWGLAFASEGSILEDALRAGFGSESASTLNIQRLGPFRALRLGWKAESGWNINKAGLPPSRSQGRFQERKARDSFPDWKEPTGLKRCTRCILPHTIPHIEFDRNGICNLCRDYRSFHFEGKDSLIRKLRVAGQGSRDPRCLVMFSGGRDSSYALHYVVRELGLPAVAFTYDWGMVTDLARRNQARLCGALGVEHIVVAADIHKKRANIRKNVEAWLRRPDLALVPLFMAGDKAFFHHANRLRQRLGGLPVIYGSSLYEKTLFKSGFAGMREGNAWNIPISQRFQLPFAYLMRFAKNPALLNSSLMDTLFAYLSYYFADKNYLNLYEFIEWEEKRIDETLIREYSWETAGDSPSTWRIGDGTAAFYNHIYATVAGFTEFDAMRSNQIRAGRLERHQALEWLAKDNATRHESLKEYASLVGFDLNRALKAIERIPKLYA